MMSCEPRCVEILTVAVELEAVRDEHVKVRGVDVLDSKHPQFYNGNSIGSQAPKHQPISMGGT